MAKRNERPSRIISENTATDNAREGGVKAGPGESRLLAATVTEWNDLAGTGETPPGNNQVMDDTPPDDSKQDQIRAMLGRQFSATEDKPEDKPVETPPAAEPAPAAVEKPPEAPATRRDILGALASEKARLKLEGELREERKARAAAEAVASDPIAAARKRGLTTEQILDLALGADEKPAPVAVPAVPDAIDQRLTAIEQREASLRHQQAMGVVESLTKDLDIPVTRATRSVTVTDSNGGQQVMSGAELIHATARRLWESDGSPAGQQHAYVAKAAPLVEAQLIEDQRGAFEAYAAKRGAPAVAPPAPKPKVEAPPALGRRTGGAGVQPATATVLPEDPDERHTAIKARMGWR